jgi:hypothetical protein
VRRRTEAELTIERLAAIKWTDWDVADRHAASRAALMREYLRRAALWAQKLGGTDIWPFFDIAAHVDPGLEVPDEILTRLERLLGDVPGVRQEQFCRNVVRWSVLRESGNSEKECLEDPFEPLFLLYERGGMFVVENKVADFVFYRVRFLRWSDHVSPDPVVQPDASVLDSMDEEQ